MDHNDLITMGLFAVLSCIPCAVIGYFVGISHGYDDGYLDGLEQQQETVDELTARLADMALRRDFWRKECQHRNSLSTTAVAELADAPYLWPRPSCNEGAGVSRGTILQVRPLPAVPSSQNQPPGCVSAQPMQPGGDTL